MKKYKIIPYRPELKILARKLRADSTLAEILLWQQIQKRQIGNYQFHRQVPMLDYIVDFYCHELQLAIEIDGITHTYEEVATNDIVRQKRLENEGVNFLRFDDLDVKTNMNWVLNELLLWIDEHKK